MHRCHGHRAVGAFQIAILAPCALVGAGYFVSVASCTEIGSVRFRLHAGFIGATGLGSVSSGSPRTVASFDDCYRKRQLVANIVGRQRSISLASVAH